VRIFKEGNNAFDDEIGDAVVPLSASRSMYLGFIASLMLVFMVAFCIKSHREGHWKSGRSFCFILFRVFLHVFCFVIVALISLLVLHCLVVWSYYCN
jgi:hypothetical protein